MKILCSISSLEFNCEFFPGTFYSKETYHPVFHLEQRKLLPYLKKWSGGELTVNDSYLLFLALLRSSELVEFRVPVFRNNQTDAIVYNNMEFLARTVIKLNTVTSPAVHFPHYVVTPETRFLSNVHHWIQNWADAYSDFQSGKARDYDNRKLAKREATLERLIKNPHRTVSSYASDLAEWAAVAGDFPTFMTQSPFTKKPVALVDFWKEIIVRCCKNEQLFTIPEKDLQELLDHCEDKVSIGSIQSFTLFQVLRKAIQRQRNFLGLGDWDAKPSYQILEESTEIESVNLKALIDSAPTEEPRPEQYAKKFDYLKAKLRWDMAKKYEGGAK